jgi:AraC family transcriptional activator FtrA
VARRPVVSPQRESGQSQYVQASARPLAGGGLARVLAWAQARLDEDLTVARLARQAAMSARTFARRFREETGTTPHR